jgi:hypothetical protein
VEPHDRLVHQVAEEQDDVLASLQLVRGDAVLEERLYGRLVDLLVEGLFLALREDHRDGALERQAYLAELGRLADRCRTAGLLPLATPEP